MLHWDMQYSLAVIPSYKIQENMEQGYQLERDNDVLLDKPNILLSLIQKRNILQDREVAVLAPHKDSKCLFDKVNKL